MLISYWSSDVCSSDLYPALRLGPPWWFHDSPEGMWRYRRQVTETAGFYNTVGFNDDPRAFPSIPARHAVARRIDCAYLALLVADHRIDAAAEVEGAVNLAQPPPQPALTRVTGPAPNSKASS